LTYLDVFLDSLGLLEVSVIGASEACAVRLCSHTFSVRLNPETSMALI